VLRPIIEKRSEQIVTVPISPQTVNPQIAALMAQATALGFILYERDKLTIDVGQQFATRMRARSGEDVFQTRAFNVPNVPLQYCKEMFPDWRLTTDTPSCKTWRWNEDAFVCMLTVLAPFLATQGNLCAGLSRALQTESEFCSRVMATVLPPLEISWVKMARGVDRLYINFMYALLTAEGEFHPPKDEQRRELAISPSLTQAVREQTLSDAMSMHSAGAILAPGFLRAMGLEQEAMARDSILQQQLATVPPKQKGTRRSKQPTWDVQAIVAQRGSAGRREYLVQWAGYDPSWEAWRQEGMGSMGDPLTTWESHATMKDTEALLLWTGTPLLETSSSSQ
jgi:hypothetical protein